MKIKESMGSRIFQVSVYIIVGLVMIACLYPFYYIAIVSVSNGMDVMKGVVKLFPVGLNFESYKIVLKDPNIGRSYINTIVYTIVGTAGNIIFTTLCAYPLSRKKFYGRNAFTMMIVFTMFFGGGMIPSYLVVQNLHMINTIWALVLPGAISTYNMIIMRTFFTGIPESLNESAYIDGANDIQIFSKIILPLSLPVIATMVLFYSVDHWNSFFGALLYINEKKKLPLQLVIRNMVIAGDLADQNASMGAATNFITTDTTIKYALIMVSTLPILIIYPFVQKYFVKGVMVGSLKG